MTSTVRSPQPVVRKHPVRGGLWGLPLGLGLAIYAVLFRVIAFGDWLQFGLIVLGGVAIGIGWAYVAPPKRNKELPPAITHPDPATTEHVDEPADEEPDEEFDADDDDRSDTTASDTDDD